MTTLLEQLGVNALAVCDCRCQLFRVGIRVDDDGTNQIKVLECMDCEGQMAVPYQTKPTEKETPNAQ